MRNAKHDEPVGVFVAYSRKDADLKNGLLTHLSGLRRAGLIAEWHDRCIEAGDDWETEIRANLKAAEIVLLLISPDFLASDYCMRVEVQCAVRMHVEKTAVVIPVILRHVEGWQDIAVGGCKLGAIEALPASGRPVTDFDNPDEAWATVSRGIRESLYKLKLPARTLVEPRQEHAKGFVDRLVNADDVTVVGLTNEMVVDYLEEALNRRKQTGKGFWENLTIIFGSRAFLSELPRETSASGDLRDDKYRLAKLEDSRDRMMRFLLAQGMDARSHWTSREYPYRLPFVGSLFHTADGSFLRVAMILPGINQKDAFYMELNSGHPFFEQLSNTFDYVRENSRRLVEWVLYGKCDETSFEIAGLRRRTHIDRLTEDWAAVVLIMLHHSGEKGHGLLLQKRSTHNAADRVDQYSNISGMVTDVDLLRALDVSDIGKYLEANYLQDRSDDDAWSEFLVHSGPPPVNLSLDPAAGVTLAMFRHAALRELKEELGLELAEPTALEFQRYYPFDRPDAVNLLFGIFGLQVDRDQVAVIRMRKPHADLQLCFRSRIDKLYTSMQMNQLLQVRFERLFVPLFDKLGID